MTTEKLSEAELTYLEFDAKANCLEDSQKEVLKLVAEVREARVDNASLLMQEAVNRVEDLEFDVENLRAELNSLKTEVRILQTKVPV